MLVPMASLDPAQERFILWLLTPKDEREPETQDALADELGVSASKLSNWKKDPEFLAEWNATYLRTIGNPGTKMGIMSTLIKTASDEDDPKHVQAAKAYFEIEGSLRPKGSVDVKVESGVPVSQLSDEQLRQMLAAKADDELAARRRQRDAG